MKTDELKFLLDRWAPPGVAWDRDNPGFQVGNPSEVIRGILLAFDATTDAVKYAKEKHLNLIITHHPLLFHPLKNINTAGPGTHSVITAAIKNDITILSYHTNLDFASGGVSFNLAGKLGLTNIRFLEPIKSKRFKLVTFVPAEVADKVSDAVFHAGGGVIGAYSKCSFSSNGKGTFYGDESSNPAVGVKGRIETVDEVRLEIIFNEWERVAVLKAITSSHPYEQPALDIYKLDNDHESFGSGAVGELSKEISETEFLKLVSQSLKIPSVRHSVLLSKKIKRVALCGGAGEEYYKAAISAGADAFVTADIRYHNFIDASGKILLVDEGHFETEAHILEEVKNRIENLVPLRDFPVEILPGNTNPVFYYIKEE